VIRLHKVIGGVDIELTKDEPCAGALERHLFTLGSIQVGATSVSVAVDDRPHVWRE
jgi:hypothetical protein